MVRQGGRGRLGKQEQSDAQLGRRRDDRDRHPRAVFALASTDAPQERREGDKGRQREGTQARRGAAAAVTTLVGFVAGRTQGGLSEVSAKRKQLSKLLESP